MAGKAARQATMGAAVVAVDSLPVAGAFKARIQTLPPTRANSASAARTLYQHLRDSTTISGAAMSEQVENEQLSSLRLVRRDPGQRMARFYTLHIAPTLFGGWGLVRE
jgi:hypothetical protein